MSSTCKARYDVPHSRIKICESESRGSNRAERKSETPFSMKMEEVILLLIYMGRRTSQIKINNISAENDAECLVAAVVLKLEDRITLLNPEATGKQKLARTEPQND